ncbi:response regulator transcription factor [Arthrobacter sp.]|uniref:response regulator transcription factor n=1 Tax=Arthrobacter sp. TaxID=1667 RepID=UPI003A9450D7
MSPKSPHIVERSAEYQELVKILTSSSPGGAVIIGGAGMGKTTMVESVLARPDVPEPVMRLHCSPTLADIPYGPLSPYLSALDRTDDPVKVLRELQVIIGAAHTGAARPVIVVEDAPFLDAESCFALSMLVENAAVKLVALGSGRVEGESTLFSLTEAGLLTTLVMRPLDVRGVVELSRNLLEGQLSRGTAEVVHSLTGGNPSFVTEFVRSSLAQGILISDPVALGSATDSDREWIIARLAPEPDDGLTELVREMHSALTPGQQQTMEILALAGPQPKALLAIAGAGEYRHLLEAGTLVTDRNGMVAIRAEIQASVLRHTIAPGRSLALHTMWSDKQRSLGLELNPIQVLWSLEVSSDVPASIARDAAARANDDMDYQLAWKICAVAGISESSEQGTLIEAQTLVGLGRHYSARALLMRQAENTSDPRVLQSTLNLLACIRYRAENGGRELEGLDDVWRNLPRPTGSETRFFELDREHTRTSELYELWQRVNTSESGQAELNAIEALVDDQDLSKESRIVALLLLADLHSVEGRTETALDMARQAMSMTDQTSHGARSFHLAVVFRICWNLLFSGRYAEAEEFLSARSGSSVRRLLHEHGMTVLLQGLGHMLQGQSDMARRILSTAIAELSLRDPLMLLPLAQSLGEYVTEHAHPQAAPFDTLSRGPRAGRIGASSLEGPQRHLLARAVAAGRSDPHMGELSRYPLIQRETLAYQHEQHLFEVENFQVTNRELFHSAGKSEGSRAGFLARLADPSVQTVPSGLQDLAADAAEAREFRVAAEALARSAQLYAAGGDTRRCGAVLRELMTLVRDQELTPAPIVAQALSIAELTNREEEIVELARLGKNNAQIAKTLTVSQRTVEGHLYRVYSKLGISDRAELFELRTPAGTNRG